MKALVIIPTYNECGNIESLINTLLALELPCRLDIMVRDDKSPDGTGDIVKKLAEKHKGRIYLEIGNKIGLGNALRKAFDSARENYDHDIIATMDADWSHQPEDLAKLIEAVESGHDVAIGSRYVKGGLIPGDWPAFFLLRTLVATRVARWVGGINEDIHELTTNMRVFTREVLNEIEYNRINLSGFSFQIMLANELTKRSKWSVTELPIAFKSRDEGDTKSRFTDIIEFFVVAYRLNPDSPAKETLRYLTVGTCGAVVNVTALYLLSSFLVDTPEVALSFAAIQISILWNFILHSNFTFMSRKRRVAKLFSSHTLQDFMKYEALTSITQLLSISIFSSLNKVGFALLTAQISAICIAFVFNYHFSRNHIWTMPKKRMRSKISRLSPRLSAS